MMAIRVDVCTAAVHLVIVFRIEIDSQMTSHSVDVLSITPYNSGEKQLYLQLIMPEATAPCSSICSGNQQQQPTAAECIILHLSHCIAAGLHACNAYHLPHIITSQPSQTAPTKYTNPFPQLLACGGLHAAGRPCCWARAHATDRPCYCRDATCGHSTNLSG